MRKTYLVIDENGEGNGVVTVGEKFSVSIPQERLISIDNNAIAIINNPQDFKLKKGKVVELTKEEKKVKEKKLEDDRPKREGKLLERIQKLEEKVERLLAEKSQNKPKEMI